MQHVDNTGKIIFFFFFLYQIPHYLFQLLTYFKNLSSNNPDANFDFLLLNWLQQCVIMSLKNGLEKGITLRHTYIYVVLLFSGIIIRAVFTWLSKGIGFGFGFTTPFGWLVYLLWFWFYDSQVKTALYLKITIQLALLWKLIWESMKQHFHNGPQANFFSLLWVFYPRFLYNILKNRFLSMVIHK